MKLFVTLFVRRHRQKRESRRSEVRSLHSHDDYSVINRDNFTIFHHIVGNSIAILSMFETLRF